MHDDLLLKQITNQKYRFTIPKSRTRLAEKGEKEEHRQLQSVMRFTQKLLTRNIKSLNAKIAIK